MRVDPCEPGPVRVLLDRADRQVIAVQTYVGPAQDAPGVTDLGAVSAQQAADYLFGLAGDAPTGASAATRSSRRRSPTAR